MPCPRCEYSIRALAAAEPVSTNDWRVGSHGKLCRLSAGCLAIVGDAIDLLEETCLRHPASKKVEFS
jgi:hypothetical protein